MLDILLEAALRATFIAVAALAVLWSLRVRAAAVRHRVWTVVMFAMLALPLAIAWAPDVSLHVLPPTYAKASGAVAPPADSIGVAAAPMEPTTSEAVALTPAPPWNWRAWLLAVYFAGAAVLLARLAIGTVRVSVLAREATVVNGVLTSARIATPFTFGWLRPRILLPEGWDRWPATRLAVVLDHERAHMARRDPLVQWLALVNRAVFWFHPLAWWLERHLAALAEEACDAAVLARGHSGADYSEHLLDLARVAGRRPMPQLVGMPMPGSGLPTRIAKILDGELGRPGSRSAAAGAAALATLAAAVLGTITLAQERITLAQETAAPRNLLEVYERALANDPVVREAEDSARSPVRRRKHPTPPSRRRPRPRGRRSSSAWPSPISTYSPPRMTLALQEAAREALSRQREQAERRFEVGLIGITDVIEMRAGSDQAAANALTAQRELGAAQAVLREVVGEPVGQLRPIVENLPLELPNPSNAEAWIATALQRNPVLVSTRLRAENADGDAEAQRAREDLERVARSTEYETRVAYLGVVSEISRVRALEQSVRSNQTALQATRAGFDVGTRTTVDVLTAQGNLRQSETAHLRSRYDYALNVLRLRGAAGELTAQELEDTKSWFE